MARGRMLSKSLSCSRRFNALRSEFAQLLYTMLLPHVDDFGRMTGDPFSVKLTVLPASARTADDFSDALRELHDSELINVYQTGSDIWLQVNKFDDHQSGLHKRTESKIPDPKSGKFPELPGNSWSRARAELNLTELKGTEGKGTEQKIPDLNNKLVRNSSSSNKEPSTALLRPVNGNGHARRPDTRSKRPIFTGQRLTVFEWFLDKAEQVLGTKHFMDFDVHEWFFALDAHAAKADIVIPQRDNGAWLEQQLIAEAARRGLPIAVPALAPSKRALRDAAAMRLMADIDARAAQA